MPGKRSLTGRVPCRTMIAVTSPHFVTPYPVNRRMAYNPVKLMETLFDAESLLLFRPDFGRSVITGLARIEGLPFAVLCSDCRHLGGAIDSEASKAADLYRFADRWQLPVVSLVDTPGFMVGPDSEREGARPK